MTPRTEIIKERHVNHLGREIAHGQTCLKRKWVTYTLLFLKEALSLSLSIDTGQMIQVSDGGITGFEILFRTVQCFGISSSYKSYKF